jgi:EF hand
MRGLAGLMSSVLILNLASGATAQPPDPGQEVYSQSATGGDLVTRMMEFDKDKDGKLTKSEVTDKRLHRLFARSDANNDGTVTKNELASLAAKEESNSRGRSFGFGPPGGGPGGMMMMPPRHGEILPPMVQQRLRLSALQKAELAAIQKEVDERLGNILTDEQKKQLQEMRQRGPGGFGPSGGGPPGGFGPGGGEPLGQGPRGGFGPPGHR